MAATEWSALSVALAFSGIATEFTIVLGRGGIYVPPVLVALGAVCAVVARRRKQRGSE